MVYLAVELGSILLAGMPPPKENETNQGELPKGVPLVLRYLVGKEDESPVLGNMTAFPELMDEKIRKAVTMVPADYWSLSCWTCREEGH